MKTVWEVTQVAVAPYGSGDVTPLKPPKKRDQQKADWLLEQVVSAGAGQLVVVWVGKVEE